VQLLLGSVLVIYNWKTLFCEYYRSVFNHCDVKRTGGQTSGSWLYRALHYLQSHSKNVMNITETCSMCPPSFALVSKNGIFSCFASCNTSCLLFRNRQQSMANRRSLCLRQNTFLWPWPLNPWPWKP